MENNYINLNYMTDREKDITVNDLKTAIRKYKREECKPFSKLNRAGLIEYVKQYEIPVKIAKKTKKETKPKPKTILKVKPVKQDKPPGMDQPIEEVDVPKVNIPQISKPVRKRVAIKVKETGTAHLPTSRREGEERTRKAKEEQERLNNKRIKEEKQEAIKYGFEDVKKYLHLIKEKSEIDYGILKVEDKEKEIKRIDKELEKVFEIIKKIYKKYLDDNNRRTYGYIKDIKEFLSYRKIPIERAYKFGIPGDQDNKFEIDKLKTVYDVDLSPYFGISKEELKELKKKSPKKTVERKKLTREEEAIIKEQERNRREEKEDKEREEKERNKQKKRNEKEEEERKAKAIKAFQEAEKLKESDRRKKRKMMTKQERDAEDYERKREKREEKSRAKYVSKADRDAEEKREKEKKEKESKQKREEAKKRMGKKTEDEEMEEIKKKLEEFRKKRAKEKEKEKKKKK